MTEGYWSMPILTYHRIGEPQHDHVPTVTPERFERHLAFLARRRCQVLPFEQFLEHLEQGTRLPRRVTLITFDDGYVETATIAAPLLRRFGFPSIVFVTPGQIGTSGFMSWEQVRGLQAAGMAVGSHTLHHTYLPLVSRDQAEQELVESKRMLERELGRPVPWLSYPVGGFTAEIQAIAKTAGYRAACTTNRGHSKRAFDLFALRRIKVTERDQPFTLSVKLSGYYDWFRRLEQPA